LPSGFYEGPTYGALYKAWLRFNIAIKKLEWDKIEIYAKRIQNLQRELGIEVSDFSDWGVE
jgi:hypothetical protein